MKYFFPQVLLGKKKTLSAVGIHQHSDSCLILQVRFHVVICLLFLNVQLYYL